MLTILFHKRELGMQNQSCKNTLSLVLLAVIGLICFAGRFHPLYAMDEKTNAALMRFSRVLEELKKNYVDEPDPDILVKNAIQGMMENLDPYSVFLPPEAFEALKATTRGEFRRDFVPVQRVQSAMLDPKGFGYIAVRYFSEHTVEDMANALKDLEFSGLSGLILDLRNNLGGHLDQAVQMSDLFLDKGVIVSIKGRHPKDERVFKARAGDVKRDYPIAVLINGSTASASEIIAAALQDHKRAVIIGSASFGKGSVQTVIPFEDGSGIKYTVARYYTPNKKSLQGRGVIPDIEAVQESDFFLQKEITGGNDRRPVNIDLLKKDPGIGRALGILSTQVQKK